MIFFTALGDIISRCCFDFCCIRLLFRALMCRRWIGCWGIFLFGVIWGHGEIRLAKGCALCHKIRNWNLTLTDSFNCFVIFSEKLTVISVFAVSSGEPDDSCNEWKYQKKTKSFAGEIICQKNTFFFLILIFQFQHPLSEQYICILTSRGNIVKYSAGVKWCFSIKNSNKLTKIKNLF